MPIKHKYTAVENATPDELVDAAEWNDTHVVTPTIFQGSGVPSSSYPTGQVSVGDYYLNTSSLNTIARSKQKFLCVNVTTGTPNDTIDWVAVNDGGNLQLTFDSNSGFTQPEDPIYADTGAAINIVGTPQIEFINSSGQSAGYAGHLRAGANNITFTTQPNNTVQIGVTGTNQINATGNGIGTTPVPISTLDVEAGLTGSIINTNTLQLKTNITASGSGVTTGPFTSLQLGNNLTGTLDGNSNLTVNAANITASGTGVTTGPFTNLQLGTNLTGTLDGNKNLTVNATSITASGGGVTAGPFTNFQLGTNLTGTIDGNKNLTVNATAGSLSWQENGVAQTGSVSTLNLGANIIGSFANPGTLTVAAGSEGQGFAIPINVSPNMFEAIGPFSFTAPYFRDLSTGVALGSVSFTATFDSNINNYPSEFTSAWLTAINATSDAVPGHSFPNVDSLGRVYLTTSPPVHTNSLGIGDISTAFTQTYQSTAGVTDMEFQDPNIFGPFVNAINSTIGVVSGLIVGGNTLTGNLILTGGQAANNININNVSNTITVATTPTPQFQYITTVAPRVSSYTMNLTTPQSVNNLTDTPLQFVVDFVNGGALLARTTGVSFIGTLVGTGDVFYNPSTTTDIYLNISGMISWVSNINGLRLADVVRCTATTTTATTWNAGTAANRVYQSLVPTINIVTNLTYNPISATIKLPAYNAASGGYQGIVFLGWQNSGVTLTVGANSAGGVTGLSTRITFVELV